MKNINEAVNDEVLYGYVFHFNPYTKIWSAIPRDNYSEYWNDANLEGVIRSSKFETIVSILYKTDGNAEKIKKLVS
jgi:hypothetical protein